jgi:hypothetical protein
MDGDEPNEEFYSGMSESSAFGMSEPMNMTNLFRGDMESTFRTQSQQSQFPVPFGAQTGHRLDHMQRPEGMFTPIAHGHPSGSGTGSPLLQRGFGMGPSAQKRPRVDGEYPLQGQSIDVNMTMTDGRTVGLKSIISPLIRRVERFEEELRQTSEELRREQEESKVKIEVLEKKLEATGEGREQHTRSTTDKNVKVSNLTYSIRQIVYPSLRMPSIS